MHRKFDYTTQARRFALKHPVFNHITIQINFWIAAFVLLSIIIHSVSLSFSTMHAIELPASSLPGLLISVIIGLFYGISLGFVDILFERGNFQKWPLGVIILFRGVTYYIVAIGMVSIIRYVLWDFIVVPYFYDGISPVTTNLTWRYYYKIMLIYTLAMAAIISFINQMNKKFGPGVLLPMLLGKYRKPREEERIFMFMDLKSSTQHAEKLGHLKYSALIRDSFMDINRVLSRHNAEVYQYVGDEIVVNWPIQEGIKSLACVEFFFSCQNQFDVKQAYYLDNYGIVPQFKAGLHLGIVTAVEIGEIKRDIAYHGDTLNTAARIQSVCNEYDKLFLVSEEINDLVELEKNYNIASLGQINLKGKDNPIGVFSVDSKRD